MSELPYAEDVAYWRTGKVACDAKIEDAARLVVAAGGTITSKGCLLHKGREGILLAFELGGEDYRIHWPVLPVKKPDAKSGNAARLQAATFVWHSVKARVSDASVLGFRAAFAGNIVCPGGATVQELATPMLTEAMPQPLRLPNG